MAPWNGPNDDDDEVRRLKTYSELPSASVVQFEHVAGDDISTAAAAAAVVRFPDERDGVVHDRRLPT